MLPGLLPMIRKGTYILVMDIPDIGIYVGSLGMLNFSKGAYCYVGSAMNGLDQRIGRHLTKEKKIRWHIDRLTTTCISIEAYEAVSQEMCECGLCEIVSENGGEPSFKGFGCSDCRCDTHLFSLDTNSRKRLCSDLRLTPYPNIHND